MNVLKAGRVDIAPTSYAMTLNCFDSDNGRLEFKMKVSNHNIWRFVDMLPLLTPKSRRAFPRLWFWIDVPVDIRYVIRFDTVDLSAKLMRFRVIENEILCIVPGYDKVISLEVDKFVGIIHDLYQKIEGKEISDVTGGLAYSTANPKETFRATGIAIKNAYPPRVMAIYNADFCVLAHYTYNDDNKQYERLDLAKQTKYFMYSDENGWEMAIALPFMAHDFSKATTLFRI